jgi:pyrroloquinoline quinone biosynthesis protein B
MKLIFLIFSCQKGKEEKLESQDLDNKYVNRSGTSLIILGTMQDGGAPHIGCEKKCCKDLFKNPDKNKKVVSLGIIDTKHRENYLFEATPDLPIQMKMLKKFSTFDANETPTAIFLTHAHIGHYTGLMFLGKEALNVTNVRIYAMPKMKEFLTKKWSLRAASIQS